VARIEFEHTVVERWRHVPIPEQQRHVRQIADADFLPRRQWAAVGDDRLNALVKDWRGIDLPVIERRTGKDDVEGRRLQLLVDVLHAVDVADFERDVVMPLRELDAQPVHDIPVPAVVV